MFHFSLPRKFDNSLLEKFGKSLNNFVFLLELFVANLVDVVFKEKHFYIVGLFQVPLVLLQDRLKLIE